MQEPPRELLLNKPLPSSEDAERAILGGIILDNGLMAQAATLLKPEDFYGALDRKVFRAMMELFNASKTIDPILIVDQLKANGESVEGIGGISTITNLTYGLPTFRDIDPYIKVVREKSSMRKLVRLVGTVRDDALSEEMEPNAVLDKAEASIYSLRSDMVVGQTTRMHVEVGKALDNARMRAQTGEVVVGVPSGFQSLDRMLQGFRGGQQIIVAARPSMGKTALATRIAYAAAAHKNVVTLVLSLEMSKSEIADRIISAECSVDSFALRTGALSEQQWNDAASVRMNLQGCAPLFINDDPYFTVAKIRAEIRRLNAELRREQQELGLVVIDHIGLLENDQASHYRGGNLNQDLTKISRGLKKLAKEFDVPFMTLCQLSRGPESRADHRPLMSDLRDSGAIEQDADVVAFIYRDDYYQKDPTMYTNIAEVIIAKNRNGPTGPVSLHFEKKYARFADLAQGQAFQQPNVLGDIIL
jgi:replicative DNA helicase